MAYTKAVIVTPLDPVPHVVKDDLFHERIELGKVDKQTKLPWKELPTDKAKKLLQGVGRPVKPYTGTTFHFFVPRPEQQSHIPAFFIRMSNPGSAPVLCRLNPGDLESLIQFLNTAITSAERALGTAMDIHNQISELNRSIDQQLKQNSSNDNNNIAVN